MNLKSRLKPLTALAFCAVTVPLLISACNSDNPLAAAQEGLCCKNFAVGADLSGQDFGLTGEVKGQFKALAQASADLGAVATGALNDVSVACESIARDVGAKDADITKVDSMTGDPKAKATAWCDLAAAAITASFSASGKFKAEFDLDFQAPKCTASVSAQANCEASCSVDGKCEAQADLKCEGGKLPTVECTGKCEATAEVPKVSCTGSCSGKCSGGCSASVDTPQIECDGKCEGTCTADGTAASGSGIDAEGNCKGKCEGTCTAKPGTAAAKCEGTCSGSCEGSCEATGGGAKFECNGKCSATAGTPPKCEGSAELDCDVSAECKSNCSASVKAKAECTPPRVAVVLDAKGTLDADLKSQLNIAIASLETNLPQLLVVFKARGQSFTDGIKLSAKAGLDLKDNIGSLSGEAVFCVPPIVEALVSATGNFKAALDGSIAVSIAAGVKP
jgi:hypothetical protein